MSRQPSVVIVGANLAGGRAAEALRAEGFEGRVTLIGEEQHRPYERPPMSKEILRGDWPVERAFLQTEEWYREHDVELRLGVRATMIDLGDRVVMAGGSLVPFEALLLATGASPVLPPFPGADLPGVHLLRTADDSMSLQRALTGGARVVVVGAGFIGSEVAATARARGCAVSVVEVAPMPLHRALGEEVGAICAAIHRDNGVALHLGRRVVAVEGSGRVERACLDDASTIDCDVVVVGIGVRPNDELAREAGIACDNGIVVDELCMTSARGVFAAGDVANHPNPILGERIRVEHWQNAQNQGVAAARAILGKGSPFAEVPWFWSDQYDVNIQMSGHPTHWDRIVYRGSIEDRHVTAFYREGPRIVAALAFNRGKDVRAARALIEHRIDVPDDVLADESTDLRAIGKAAYTSDA